MVSSTDKIMGLVHEQSDLQIQNTINEAHQKALSESYNIEQFRKNLELASGFKCGHSGSHIWIHNDEDVRIAIIHNLLR